VTCILCDKEIDPWAAVYARVVRAAEDSSTEGICTRCLAVIVASQRGED
jgi:hypothetical protein